VVERASTPSGPTVHDPLGLPATYELVRLSLATKDDYFSRAFPFTVTPSSGARPGSGGIVDWFQQTERLRDIAAHRAATLLCYRAKPDRIVAKEGNHLLADAADCASPVTFPIAGG